MAAPSVRAEAVTRRTYNRPLDADGNLLETWEQTAERATFKHHLQLWEKANTNGSTPNLEELRELQQLVTDRKALVAGRTLWLGGTEYGIERACSQFNCAYSRAQTVYQFVDIFWLLLNGCGVGFRPIAGTLHGFLKPIRDLEIISSTRSSDHHGEEKNKEEVLHQTDGYYWTIRIGDSAESWAKALGKLVNPPRHAVKKLTIDFSDVRGPGKRLKGYGWICNGSKPLEEAFRYIFRIMNSKAGDLLDEIDLLDIVNHLGTVLSSRRSAQIALMDWGHPRWDQFARAKKDWFLHDNEHRQQSNNSLVFWSKPSKRQIRDLMTMIWECGGSEPGFINGESARRRAPWFDGLNPCGEILLSSNGFCNLVTTAVSKFQNDFAGLLRTIHIMSRANYRQTCVELTDNVLSPEWHQTNEALRLCGVSLTGLAQSPWLTDYQIKTMRNTAIAGTYSMADELGLPRPKLVTTLKPEGTGSKCIDTTEGIHKPLGRYIFNWISFNVNDPIVRLLSASGYRVLPHPTDKNSMLICFPVEWQGVRFSDVGNKWVNQDTAVEQLTRYRRWNTLWTDHNTSITVSWDISELDEIVDWLYKYWEDFVAVSWMKRADPNMSAADLGYKYLPQDVVKEEEFRTYEAKLQPVEWGGLHGIYDVNAGPCGGGACPVK
jgi:ribonucleoside-triphosphate reductase